MSINKITKKLIVVADDFTGANDAGVQFRKAGLQVKVIIDTQQLKEDLELTDVLVMDLESRFDSAQIAFRKCYDLGKELFEIGNTIIYKKIDSTFRGNIGAEIDGLMSAMQLKLAVLAPALPSSGRTTINGEVYVDHVKLARTEFAADPRTPVKYSRIADIIALQSSLTCREISTELFQEKSSALADELLEEINEEAKIFIFDSREENDLLYIAKLVESISEYPIMIIGSAGLAHYLTKLSFKRKKAPAFVFSGSVSEQTRKQIHHTMADNFCSLFLIKAEDLLDDEFNAEELIAAVSNNIGKGISRFIFTSALTRADVDKVLSLAAGKGLSNEEAADKVAITIGNLAAVLIKKFSPSGVLLTGGDIAIKTVRALHGSGFSIDQEIVPGISSGTLTGSAVKTIIATKSGGFGAIDAITKTLEFFKV